MMDDDYRSWADLPTELLALILDHLWFFDHACFAAVCKPWRSVAAKNPHLQSVKFPWLIFSTSRVPVSLNWHTTIFPPEDTTWYLSSPFEDRSFYLDLPVPRGATCVGVSCGWLIIAMKNRRGNYMVNPLTKQKIDLPLDFCFRVDGFPGFKATSRDKVILSSAVTPGNIADGKCMVVAMNSDTSRLYFCRPGDQIWSNFPRIWSRMDVDNFRSINNFIALDGYLYCINGWCEVLVFKLTPQPTLVNAYGSTSLDNLLNPHLILLPYLVESNGELLIIRRCTKDTTGIHRNVNISEEDLYLWNKLTRFEVFKLDTHGSTWVRMKSLGDQVLFLGNGCSRSITLTTNSYFRRNCIYFIWHYPESYLNKPQTLDWSVFCMEDESIQSFRRKYSQPLDCESLWFMLGA